MWILVKSRPCPNSRRSNSTAHAVPHETVRLSDSRESNTVFLHGLNWLRPSITLSSLPRLVLFIDLRRCPYQPTPCCLVKRHPAKLSPSLSFLQHLPVPTFSLFVSFCPLSCQHRFAFPLPRPIDPSEPCLQSRPVPAIFFVDSFIEALVLCTPLPSLPSVYPSFLEQLVNLLDELKANLTIPRQPKRKAAEVTIPTEGRSLRQRRLPPEGTKQTIDTKTPTPATASTTTKSAKSANLPTVPEGALKSTPVLSSLQDGPPTPQTAVSIAMDSDDDFMSNMSSEDDVMHDDSDNGILSGGEGEPAPALSSLAFFWVPLFALPSTNA